MASFLIVKLISSHITHSELAILFIAHYTLHNCIFLTLTTVYTNTFKV